MAVAVYGDGEQTLRLIERSLGVAIHARGNEVRIEGEPEHAALARRVLEELYALLESGKGVRSADVRHVIPFFRRSFFRRLPGWLSRLRNSTYDAVINLAGASIFCRWTRANKRVIRESRVETTRNVVDALAARRGKETILISASGAGYYGFREEEGLGEDASPGTRARARLQWKPHCPPPCPSHRSATRC